MRSSGLPGLAGVEHIGFTVPDMAQAMHFFLDVIGCTEVYRLAPFECSDAWMQTHLNVGPGIRVRDVRLLRCGHGPNFEIFEFEDSSQRREPSRNSDVGGHHLAFYVADIDAAIAHLLGHGVTILGEPTIRDTGPSAGLTWVYFLAPWGMQLELVSFPRGKAYEANAPTKLWHPLDPAN